MAHNCCAPLTVHAANRVDPTRTTLLRNAFEAEIYRRFRALKGAVNKYLVGDDSLALKANFTFTTSPAKVAQFMAWLRKQEAQGILGIRQGTPVEAAARTAWTNVYVESAYQKGLSRGVSALKKGGVKVAPSFIDSAFRRPIHADRLGLIYTRTFSELDGITKEMDRQISRVLTQGVADGLAPGQIAAKINNRIDAIGITRARTLARTEIINAHADATLNTFSEAGIAGVEVESEFVTAGDDDVCPECAELEGKTYTIDEARGVIPVHPNCRCAWVPVVVNGTGIELS
jgi:SPP1 gp7 family putative phage head morphogenesis protein